MQETTNSEIRCANENYFMYKVRVISTINIAAMLDNIIYLNYSLNTRYICNENDAGKQIQLENTLLKHFRISTLKLQCHVYYLPCKFNLLISKF